MRCNNALDRVVPFPTNWKTAIPFVLKVKKLCQAATTDAKRKAKNFSITCELMGLPLDSDRLDALCGKEAGSLVSLPEADTEMSRDFLLAAHVQGDTWLCHPGSDADGKLCVVAPFEVKDLVVKSIPSEKLFEDPESRKRRRISRKTLCRDLLSAAESNPSAWSTARAYALWLAEKTRAEEASEAAAFRLDQAQAGFESDPFRWEATRSEWLSQKQIGFLWTWKSRGQLRHDLVFVRANHISNEERQIPCPDALKEPWAIWRSRLEDAAAKHFFCKYLGVKVGPDFEPDPEKWKAGPAQDKKFLTVWYEWQHVTKGPENEPYRVEIVVNSIVHGGRDVPHHPCTRSCPRSLRFNVEYMQGMAEWKSGYSGGARYIGICYESDRPDFLCEVPDGGLDIQDQSVYWHFANGVEFLSLSELYLLPETHFEIQEEEDARYLTIGRQTGWDLLGICEDEISLAEYDRNCITAQPFPLYSCTSPYKHICPMHIGRFTLITVTYMYICTVPK